jgi:nucleotide-binding universal stress UspA family protein
MVAVDVAGAEEGLLENLGRCVQRLLQTEPGARLACVTVMRTNRVGMDELTEADGSSKHVNLLVQLRHWARPLMLAHATSGVPDGRVTFQVLESPDPASAIVDFARKNQVDQIVLGARSSGGLRRYLGSVSAKVAADADCTVTVVRSIVRDNASPA